ncbi:hypothetical protein ACFQ44_00460 [Levilactobacillus lanxiensis]|uniref:ABC transporter ATP-binding protein n=1 Tax=Levilactobacillus lanxiensis TaxID=2799568 RepID=A0ABW4D060_9LACO|nr:hypothetical protein [Levilactobacillus lanxiensis]
MYDFKFRILASCMAVVPTAIIGAEWYINLSMNETPLEFAVAILLLAWVWLASLVSSIVLLRLISICLYQKSIQQLLKTPNLNYMLESRDLQDLYKIFQALDFSYSRRLRKVAKKENIDQKRKRLIGAIIHRKILLEMDENKL